MGAIKTISDTNLTDNTEGAITPEKHKQINDTIDNEVENVKTAIQNLRTVPTGQNINDVLMSLDGVSLTWYNVYNLGFCRTNGFTMQGTADLNGQNIENLGRITETFQDPNTYTNTTVFFEPDAENDYFLVNAPINYESDVSAKFTERSHIDKGFFDAKVKTFKGSVSVPPMAVFPIEFNHPYGDDVPIFQLWRNNQLLTIAATISTGKITFPDQNDGTYTLVAFFI